MAKLLFLFFFFSLGLTTYKKCRKVSHHKCHSHMVTTHGRSHDEQTMQQLYKQCIENSIEFSLSTWTWRVIKSSQAKLLHNSMFPILCQSPTYVTFCNVKGEVKAAYLCFECWDSTIGFLIRRLQNYLNSSVNSAQSFWTTICVLDATLQETKARKAPPARVLASTIYPTYVTMITSQIWINKAVAPQDRHKDEG